MATDNVSLSGSSKSLRWKLGLFIILCVTLVLLCIFLSVQRYDGIPAYFGPWKPYYSDARLSSVSHNTQEIHVLSYEQSEKKGDQTVSNSEQQELNVTELDRQKLNVTVSQYQSYLRILKGYNERLATFPRHHYGPSEKYITYGEPLGKVPPSKTFNTGPRMIFAWTGFYGNWNWLPKNIICPGGLHCIGSKNRSEYEKSDVVVMYARDMQSYLDLPQTRPQHQIWLYFLIESPKHQYLQLRKLNGIFNWTATYRRDSDIAAPYFRFKARENKLSETEFSQVMKNIMAPKQKHLVAYMNSNCFAPHTTRLSYIAELKKYIPVDMYGKCGSLNCPRNSANCTATLTQYKFYLGLENSYCRDYITEKVRQPLLEWNSVPVVMGADDPGNYAELLPSNSYIHTSGFKSPKDLAEYLLLLDNNPALYEKYHRWRITHEMVNHVDYWCQVCLKLQNLSLPSQTYTDFLGWYNEDICKSF